MLVNVKVIHEVGKNRKSRRRNKVMNVCRKSQNKISGSEFRSESVEVYVREGWFDGNRMSRR